MKETLQPGVVGADDGRVVDVLGHTYTYQAYSEVIFAFRTYDPPGTGIPAHIHPHQDEFILVLEGEYRLRLGDAEVFARPGELVVLPRGIPHAYFNNSDTDPARAMFWVNPAGKLRELFEALATMAEGTDVVELSRRHDVDFI
jgi:quercetin dioxygenase-like cupin family protein